jgi:hypothetical protein
MKVPSIDTSLYPMWFRPRHEFVRASVVDTNAVEGTSTRARIRFTRLFNGPPINIYFSVWGNAIPAGLAREDHNVPQFVQFQMPTNVLSVDTNLTALADGGLEGWETTVIATQTNAVETCYEFRSPLMAFLRDNVSLLTGLPETDTDADGLADRWEVANGLDPFSPGDEALDPDKDGLINEEESRLNLDPNSDDTDGDGELDFAEANQRGMTDADFLEVRLYTRDVGKVNNGMNCAVCHTTTLRVGDNFHYSPKHTVGTEKSFFFKRGTNYPVYLSELMRDLPPQGQSGNPTTTQTYTAGIVPAENEPRAFVVTDPNNKLGTNKAWANFPTDPTVAIGNLIVPKIEVFWTNYFDNIALDDNPNAGGGVRVFPDQISPTDNSTTRNRVRVLVKTTPALPGQVVRLKSFDVDDPTQEFKFVEVDPNDVLGIAIGNDNRGAPNTGQLAQATLTLDNQGEATTDFAVTMQPGDNFRVAALLDTLTAPTHLNQLQVTSEFGEFYVWPNNEGIPGFVGGISPMLTVWRKLHLEFDSMLAPPATGSQANFVTGSIVQVTQNFPTPGQSRISVRHGPTEEGLDFFAQGKLFTAGFGNYRILASATRGALGNEFLTQMNIDGLPGLIPISTAVSLFDDDDQYLANDPLYPSLLNLQSPPLPLNQRSVEVTLQIQEAYADAYILPVDGNTLNFNSQQQIPFERNAPAFTVAGTPFDDGNLELKGVDRPSFWAFSVVFGYQSEAVIGIGIPFGLRDDGDPDTEIPVEGAVPKTSPLAGPDRNRPFGYAVIFMENIRDAQFGRRGAALGPINYVIPDTAANLADRYLQNLYAVIAHEIGHAPGRQWGKTDHDEGKIMQSGASQSVAAKFSSKTILRFRSAASWTQ